MIKKGTYKQTYHKRPSKMYINIDRVCGECGNNKTSFTAINHVLWHREVDEQGRWTGKYLCHKCYGRRYRRKREQDVVLMRKKFIEERSSKLEAKETKEEKEELECAVL